MQLIVAEKPSVARDLARVLGVPARGKGSFEGPGHVITWCIGHLLELEEPAAYDGRWKVWRMETLPMLPGEFKLRPARHARAQLRVVVDLLRERRFTVVVNACDAGREGELIFRHILQRAGRTAPVRRLWISSLTDEAIRRGFAALRPGAELDALADAARSRSEADWLVGMNATRAITLGLRRAGGEQLLSIGRVQTPTLAMLVQREAAIRDFVPRDYWEVRASLAAAPGATRFTARWCHGPISQLPSAALAGEVVVRCTAHGGAADPRGPRVHSVESRVMREPPPLLFDLTALQRTANRRFGFSAQRTLTLAQALYERHKVLTYPRTDSRHLGSDMVSELPAVLAALAEVPAYAGLVARLGQAPLRLGRRVVDDAKVSDHHAIIPTARAPGAALDGDERRLYDLVVRRFLGAFYPDAEVALTDVVVRVGGPGTPPPQPQPRPREPQPEQDVEAATWAGPLPAPPDWFAARGRVRMVAGWQEVAGLEPRQGADSEGGSAGEREGAGDEVQVTLPALQPGQALGGDFTPVARKTQPPRRHTEATLLGAMESAGRTLSDDALRAAMKDSGLGTPATRAAIIETLLVRDYVRRDGKLLVPTPTGSALIESLPVPSLASAELTGRWEARLAAIARGQDSRDAFMRDIATWVRELVELVRNATPTAAQLAAAAASPMARPGRGGRGGRGGGGGRGGRGARAGRAASAHAASPRAAAPRAASPRTASPRAAAPRAASPRTASPRTASPRTAAPRAAAPRQPPVPVTALPCPRCKQGSLLTGKRGWGCARWREGCGFVIWFETAGRKLSEAQLRDLVLRGKTRRARFVSAQGQPTEGQLVLDPASDGGARLVPR